VLVAAVKTSRVGENSERQTSMELSRQQSDTTSCDTVSVPDTPTTPNSDGKRHFRINAVSIYKSHFAI